MAMLAEPRQRKRYQLTPRGKALYEDDTRFGTKMLEKMGWTKGKGLGPKEDGNKDFVRQRYKNDAEGLGYEARDDQWTEHEKRFTGLLETLNGEHGDNSNSNGSNGKTRDEASDEETTTVGFGFAPAAKEKQEKLKEKFSGESLEEKSKRSKARVHYKKFTRGKDLTLYSEKDLANIFGKKASAAEEEANSIYQSFAAIRVETTETTNDSNEDADTKEENVKESGVQIITSTLSVSDYFKQKMAALKSKMANGNTVAGDEIDKEEKIEENVIDTGNQIEIVNNDNEIIKKKKSKKHNKVKTEEVEEVAATAEIEPITVVEKSAKKKKQKTVVVDIVKEEEIEEQIESPKKVKKRKRSIETISVAMDHIEVPVIEPELKKKKKKSKSKDEQIPTSATTKNPSKSTNIVLAAPVVQSDCDAYDSTEEMIKTATSEATRTNDLSKLTPVELQAKLKSFTQFTISTFCAEKFRNCDLNRFPGSNISDFVGYSFDNNLTLDIRDIKGDEQRIMRLWSCALNKYDNQLPRNTFHKYTKQVINARRAKAKKMPRFSVKTWKRKNAFQSI